MEQLEELNSSTCPHHPFNFKSPSTRDASFASETVQFHQPLTSKATLSVGTGTHSSQFHQCEVQTSITSSGPSSWKFQAVQDDPADSNKGNSTSEVHSIPRSDCVYHMEHYGSQLKGYFMYIVFCVGLNSVIQCTHRLVNLNDNPKWKIPHLSSFLLNYISNSLSSIQQLNLISNKGG